MSAGLTICPSLSFLLSLSLSLVLSLSLSLSFSLCLAEAVAVALLFSLSLSFSLSIYLSISLSLSFTLSLSLSLFLARSDSSSASQQPVGPRALKMCLNPKPQILLRTELFRNLESLVKTLTPKPLNPKPYTLNTKSETFQINGASLHTPELDATRCNLLQQAATPCNSLKNKPRKWSLSQHTATRCNMLYHAATCCNTLKTTVEPL